MRRRLALLLLLLLLPTAAGACGGGSSSGSDVPRLRVAAAASLKDAMLRYARAFPDAHSDFSFAGSDVLAAQIRAGGRPDVFAAANAKLPAQLAKDGLVETPVAFARNRLVIATPAGRRDVTSIGDLARPGTTIALGAASVPVGAYTRDVLGRLPAATRDRILANVRSEEPDVSGVVGKIAQGAVTAGFVYATDVKASGGRLHAVDLPAGLRPEAVYAAAVVKGTKHPREARAFVAGLAKGAGQRALLAAGYLPAP